MQQVYLQLRTGHSVSNSLEGVCLTHCILAAMHKQDGKSQFNQRRVSEVVLQNQSAYELARTQRSSG